MCTFISGGLAGHPQLERSKIPQWIAGEIAKKDQNAFRQIIGNYIALVDDRKTGAVSTISDVAGTRPFFAGFHHKAMVFGSNVWALAVNGWISPRLNFDAIAAWVRGGYAFTEGSLFSDLSLVEPGAVTTFGEGQPRVKSYVEFQGGCHKPTVDEFLENVHAIVSRAFQSGTRELGAVQIALSGGFDSRYLAALAMSHGLDLRAACLNDQPSEGKMAAETARRLELSLKVIETDGSRWNAYDEPFHFAPSGFPITKQQSYQAAIRNPGMPCLNGFLGGELIRDTVDRLEAKLIFGSLDENARAFQRAQNMLPYFARFDLVEPGMLDRCDERTLPACRRHIARYSHTANMLAAAMCLRRHRTFFGNNFVQHMAFAEPILPFAGYDLIQVKCQTNPDLFNFENYAALLARFYPKLADVPHNDRASDKNKTRHKKSKATPRWAMAALSAMTLGNGLRILDAKKTIPRLIGALRAGEKADVTAMFAYRLHLLERRLGSLGVELDWDAI